MPIYDYCCEARHTTEALRKYTDRDACPPCPECGAPTLRMLPLVHRPPDGLYSHAENFGRDPEKRMQAIAETGRP